MQWELWMQGEVWHWSRSGAGSVDTRRGLFPGLSTLHFSQHKYGIAASGTGASSLQCSTPEGGKAICHDTFSILLPLSLLQLQMANICVLNIYPAKQRLCVKSIWCTKIFPSNLNFHLVSISGKHFEISAVVFSLFCHLPSVSHSVFWIQ